MSTTAPTQRQASFIAWQIDSHDMLPDKFQGSVNIKKSALEDWIIENLDINTASEICHALANDHVHVAISQLKHLGYEI